MPDLDEILAGRENASVDPQPTPEQPAPVEQPQPTPEVPAEPTEGDGAQMVPVAALQAERQKAKRYTEQVAEFDKRLAEQEERWAKRFDQLTTALQPKPAPQPAPDFWEAPENAVQHHVQQAIQPLQQALLDQQDRIFKSQAIDKYGAEAVETAYAALGNLAKTDKGAAQAEYSRIMSSPNPYGALVEWDKRRQAMAEIGDDPAAYRDRIKAEILAELQSSAGGNVPGRSPAPVMPSNFAAGRNVGTRSGPAWGGPQPIGDILDMRAKPR